MHTLTTISGEPVDRETGDKVKAIKGLRALTGMGLKESKETIEAVWEGSDVVIRLRPESEIANNQYINNFQEAYSLLAHGGCCLVNSRKNAADRINSELKKLATFAIDNDCYSISQDILELLNKLDSQRSNAKRDKK